MKHTYVDGTYLKAIEMLVNNFVTLLIKLSCGRFKFLMIRIHNIVTLRAHSVPGLDLFKLSLILTIILLDEKRGLER